MSKVLYIRANPKEDKDSLTFKLSNVFIDEYMKKNPEDEIKVIDLYKEKIEFLYGNDLENTMSQESKMYPYAKEFAEADKYIFAAPMWNLSVPSILKAYFDYITLVNVTFKYTEKGPIGLLNNKKAVHIVTRGGSYSNPPMNSYEMGDKYIRTILSFMGVGSIDTIALELADVLQGEAKEAVILNAENKAKEVANIF